MTIVGKGVPLDGQNIDTDQIIPGRFVYAPREAGEFGHHLFHDQRYLDNGETIPTHPLNDARHAGASFLIAEENFGAGSARPQAVWAIQDYGIEAVLAVSFGGVFRSNSSRLDLVPAIMKREEILFIKAKVRENPEVEIRLDLRNLTVSVDQDTIGIEMNKLDVFRLTSSLDDFALTRRYGRQMQEFERDYVERFSWASLRKTQGPVS